METIIDSHDGFYFLPSDEEDCELVLKYFVLNEEFAGGEKVGSCDLGDMYHIAFFKSNEEGLPEFDEHFEAIFGDPFTYIEGLVGSNLFGCVLRKTNKSAKWWDLYLTKTIDSCKMLEKAVAEAVN
jgi:hypothetical protein